MSKQLVVAAAGLATTTGVGSQYISSAGEAVSSLNYNEGFSAETDSESFHQAFATATPSTFLTEGVETGSEFVAEELSVFENAAQFKVVEEKVVTPEPVKSAEPVVKVAQPEVKVETPKVEVAPVKPVAAPKPVPAKAPAKKVVTVKKAAPKKPGDEYKTLIKFKANGWGHGGWLWSEASWTFHWTHGDNYYKTKYLDVKRFVAQVGGRTKMRGFMEVRCNKDNKGFRCWDSVAGKAFSVLNS